MPPLTLDDVTDVTLDSFAGQPAAGAPLMVLHQVDGTPVAESALSHLTLNKSWIGTRNAAAIANASMSFTRRSPLSMRASADLSIWIPLAARRPAKSCCVTGVRWAIRSFRTTGPITFFGCLPEALNPV